MRTYLLAAVAIAAIASSAAARDGSGYVGIEGGLLFPSDSNGDAFIDFTTTQTPATPLAPAGPGDREFDDAFEFDYKRGYDIDLIAGYDFGMFRLEGELGYKRAKLDELGADGAFITLLNTSLNRPSLAPDPGAPGQPALAATVFDLNDRVTIRSAMVNALIDIGNEDGFSFYAGGGFGRAWVKMFGEKDNDWAWQAIVGVRAAISNQIDIGLKYRYFRTDMIEVSDEAIALAGNPDRFVIGTTAPVTVDRTTNALVVTDFEDRFTSQSLLLSLVYNFAAPPPLPPPAPPPPPPPPPPPATQTCPDGSVILATDVCPLPPPPPPPPPPEPERG